MDEYLFRHFRIRAQMMEAIHRYVEKHQPVGKFLTAVICNDLREACAYADDDNLINLPAFVGYFYNEAPSLCWGSRKQMEYWLNTKPAGVVQR